MSFSNFPFQGSLAESLKNSYQAYWKQDAEARESNRQLLVKLQRFEFKASELCSRTQIAHQMKAQYEKMLVNQNPLLWAQIQRTLASDVSDLHCHVSLHGSMFKTSKEAAVNTMDSSSCSEDGVWPQSPSPHPDMERKSGNFPEEQEMTDQNEQLKRDKVKHETLIVPTVNYRDRSFPEKQNFLLPSNPEIHLSPAHSDKFLSTQSSPSTAFATSHLEPEQNQHIKEPVHQEENPSNQTHLEQLDHDNRNKTFTVTASDTTQLEKNGEIQEYIPEIPPQTFNEKENDEIVIEKPVAPFKPFRLDSDSESVAISVSGPTGPPAEEDSDSFWN